jgi:hypothetical protein
MYEQEERKLVKEMADGDRSGNNMVNGANLPCRIFRNIGNL